MGTTIVPPVVDRRLLALRRANDAKQAKAHWRGRVRRAPRDDALALAADLVEDVPELLASTMVWELLGWVPGLGEVRCERLLLAAGVGLFRRLGELTARQRAGLAAVLRSAA